MNKHKLASLGIAAIVVFAAMSGFVSTAQARAVIGSVSSAAPASPTFQLYGASGPLIEIASPAEYAVAGSHFFDIRNVPLKLLNVRYFVVSGHLVNGRFGYPVQAKADKGIKLGGIELASNDQAHTQLLAVGTPTPASAAVVDRLSGTPVSAVSPATSGSGYAPLHLIWRDPLDIWVTETWDVLNWTYDGYQVDSITGVSHHESWVKDGWFELVGPSYSSGIDYSGSRRYDAYVSTSVIYANGVFCAVGGGATYVEVVYNTAIGYYDGSREPSYDTYDYGGCAGLLSYFWQWG